MLNIKPGEDFESEILINSVVDSELDVEIVQLEKDENNENTQLKIANLDIPTDWIILQDSNLNMVAGDEKDFTIKFEPDQTQSLGSYILGVRFTENVSTIEQNSSQALAQPEIIILVLINIISDNIDENSLLELLDISKFSPQNLLNFSNEILFDINLKNNGLTYLIPKGVLKIKNEFTSEEISYDFNNESKSVLRESNRNFQFSIFNSQNFLPAKYSSELSVVYGTSNKVIQASSEFWYVPPGFVVIGFVLGGFVLIKTFRRK